FSAPAIDSVCALRDALPFFTGFDLPKLIELGGAVRDLFASGARNPERVTALVDDAYLAELAKAVTGGLGGQVGVAPRVFLRKLVDRKSTRLNSSHVKNSYSG